MVEGTADMAEGELPLTSSPFQAIKTYKPRKSVSSCCWQQGQKGLSDMLLVLVEGVMPLADVS